MGDIENFDELNHRTESASAVFQKGLYHLFMLKSQNDSDVFTIILRKYQAIYQICLAQLLLDKNYSINSAKNRLPRRLKELCQNRQSPTRNDLDPACLITHSVFENRKWNGFVDSHPLKNMSRMSLDIFSRIVDARHNLIYRPFLLNNLSWQDCSLLDLLQETPTFEEIEKVYKDLFSAILDWRLNEAETRSAAYFIQSLFMVYADHRDNRPTETILSTYARMMTPNDSDILNDLLNYRNELLNIKQLINIPGINIPTEWRVGEL